MMTVNNDENNFIQESLEEAGFSATYESDRLHEYTRQIVSRHLEEFYVRRFELNGPDVYNQIQNYLNLKFGE